MKKTLLILGYIIMGFALYAQNTVGLLSYSPEGSFDGYTMIFPHNQPNVYLLNNCGEVVHQWDDESNFRPGNVAYLREDGSLVKTKRDADITNDIIWAGGGGETIEIRSWDNDLIWSYTLNDSTYRLHHDIAPMENGNILAIAWERYTESEAIQAGRNPETIANGEIWSEYIFEIDPETTQIVWEWRAWDHLIQDFDESKDNFGLVGDPGKIDINYDTRNGGADWIHLNAIDYNEDLDQIMLCTPYHDEVWIIDHSTTTEQAAGSSGGDGNRGGDFMYRWGNQKAYTRDTLNTQKLFFPHDAHWLNNFILPSHPRYNSIGVFNNRVGADFSKVNSFKPPWDMYSWEYTLGFIPIWGPENFDLDIKHPIDSTFLYSTGLSSMQLLPNDNVLITSGRFGYTFEITPENDIVWEYKTPFNMGQPATQGDFLVINNNLTFRSFRYPPDYPAFNNKDLSNTSYIELSPNQDFCDELLDSPTLQNIQMKVYPNPTTNYFMITWEGGSTQNHLQIFDLAGNEITSSYHSGGKLYVDCSQWIKGMYIVKFNGQSLKRVIVH